MRIKTINIKNRTQSINDLKVFKNKNYGNIDIKIDNLHLQKLNTLIGKNVFQKNDAYISAETLWELMQEPGSRGHHNYHGLTTETLLDSLKSLATPFCVLKTFANRLTVISSIVLNKNRLLTIIEINASLGNNQKAKINKIVTIYPKERIERYIRGKTVLYYSK